MPSRSSRTRLYSRPFFGTAKMRFPAGMDETSTEADAARIRLAALVDSAAGGASDVGEVRFDMLESRVDLRLMLVYEKDCPNNDALSSRSVHPVLTSP